MGRQQRKKKTKAKAMPKKGERARPKKDQPKPRQRFSQDLSLKKEGAWQKTVRFLREVKVELNKVTWPSRKETMASTLVVIVLVLIISFFLGLVDLGLSKIVSQIIG